MSFVCHEAKSPRQSLTGGTLFRFLVLLRFVVLRQHNRNLLRVLVRL